MPALALRPYVLALRDEQTGRTSYLAPGGHLVSRRAHAAPLAPEVAERLALAANETDAGRMTASAQPL